MIALTFAIIICYLLGSIPTAYIFGKVIRGIDIRRYGSGNVGATNVFRVVGKGPGIAVLLADMAKGALAVGLVASYFHYRWPTLDIRLYQIITGISVVMGHNWTVFLRFRGGKGMATSAGVLMWILPGALALTVAVWLVMILIWRYVSLGSITAACAFPVFVVFLYQKEEGFLWLALFSVLLSIVAIYKHIPNIKKLLGGKEGKISLKKSK